MTPFSPCFAGEEEPLKKESALYPAHLRETSVSNANQYPWAEAIQNKLVEKVRPWLECSDDELWGFMFGPSITRTWMVWSDGYCPHCRKDVKMYNWKIDEWNFPFKVECPHCGHRFPTNDFLAYYRSGFNEQGVFAPDKADRSLLFNQEHPDPTDPLHLFGVDDGEGYVEGDKRWRFIGYYLIAGQWRKKMVGGAAHLSEAYFATGDPVYAHKAAILLDRIADLYPSFDFQSQGLVYEKGGHRGYVTVWHDACEDVRELAQAYDRIFDGIRQDSELISFLSQKAEKYHLKSSKSQFADIQQNIETNIFRHTQINRNRIESNFPRTPIALLTIEAVLGWPQNREKILAMLSEILAESIKEDGMTGEKGLSGYTTIFPRSFSELAARFDRLDPSLLQQLYQRFPDLHKTYRFHIDTWCLDKYYPREGDCGWFGSASPHYQGASFSNRPQNAEPSMYQFFWRLYEITRDPAFVQILYRENDLSTEGLPFDICAGNPREFQRQVDRVIQKHGSAIAQDDVNLEQWGLSILRSGQGGDRRAVWLDHDAGGRHSHRDGLNLGLFAKGLDLLPDFGYPPVGYGGWSAPKAVWYTQTAAHNTVAVDEKEHAVADGKTTLWGTGKQFDVVRVSAPELIAGKRFERTIAKIDLSGEDFYVIDLFQAAGGSEHALFLSSNFGTAAANGLSLDNPIDLNPRYEVRNFMSDPQPLLGWSVDWNIDDKTGDAGANSRDVHLRYTSLTEGAEAALGQCWIDASNTFGGSAQWIPRLMIRRRTSAAPLSTLFAGILEPYENRPLIEKAGRMGDFDRDKCIALIIELTDGRKQIFMYNDFTQGDRILTIRKDGGRLESDAEIAFLSLRNDKIEYACLCNGSWIRYKEQTIELDEKAAFQEIFE
ncbi:MAG: heparinase II/III family protein [Candidatus Omnitrophica bacterium]|nr:heparinase II/III family protein [Candidatus Omnitrophota bacterium]